ncbi:MAG: cyclic nucleotide-binding domain-containing protein [Bryobacterales bacterium]|nr:cyclic nucleotide-binding domain-containing protein [Bryobacterales bacterium]
MENLEKILSEHPFFEGIEKAYLDILVGCASNVRFEAGAYLGREGEDATSFFLIRKGKVALEIRTPQRPPLVILTLEDGDILGFSWLVPPHLWRFDMRAVEPVRALALDGRCLRRKCDENHDLGYELLKRFAYVVDNRLQATRLQLLDVYAAARS